MATLPGSYGYVVGRFVYVVGDTNVDEDRMPDVEPAVGSITLTPRSVPVIVEEPSPRRYAVKRPITLSLDSEGYILDPAGARGVWLMVGTYQVSFSFAAAGVSISSFDITVTSSHTEEAPLDLALAQPITPSPTIQFVVNEQVYLDTLAARDEAAAFGGTNDTIVRNLIADPNSETAGQLSATIGDVAPAAVLPVTDRRQTVLVFDGDSQTAGAHQKWDMSISRQVTRGLGANVDMYLVALGGQSLGDMQANASDVDSKYDPTKRNVLVAWAGTNDLGQSSLTAEDAQNRYVAYCNSRRALGWEVIVGTALPRSNEMPETAANYETKRQAFNTWLRANWQAFADGLADIGGDAQIGQAGQETNLTYYVGDNCHLSTTGASVASRYIRGALGRIGLGSVTRPDEWVWLDALDAVAVAGTPAIEQRGNAYWRSFDPDTVETITWNAKIPVSPQGWTIWLIWTCSVTSGTVVWNLSMHELAVDGVFNPAATLSAQTGMTVSGTANTVVRNQLGTTGQFVPETGKFQSIKVTRSATHAADTAAGDAYLLGVLLTPPSSV